MKRHKVKTRMSVTWACLAVSLTIGVLTTTSAHAGKAACTADLNCDQVVNVNDVLTLIQAWGLTNHIADINGSGVVNVDDLLLCIGAWGPCAGGAVELTVPMRWVEAPRACEVIPKSWQTTVACQNGATMEIVTNGLIPGHTYTLWFTFFENPENCIFAPNPEDPTLRCGFADLLNAATDGNLVWGDGLVAKGTNDVFNAFIARGVPPTDPPVCAEGDICTSTKVAFAWGDDDTATLTNPLGAEYQATLRNHGPEDPQYMPEQIETHMGGCEPDDPYYPCRDDQCSGMRCQVPLECFPDEDPTCATSIFTSAYPFVVGTGSGLHVDEPVWIAIAAKDDGKTTTGNFQINHTNATGELIAQLEGEIDCITVNTTTAITTGTITSGIYVNGKGATIDVSDQPIAITVHDNGPAGDVIEYNGTFRTSVPVLGACDPGVMWVTIDDGNFIVVDN